MPDPVADGFRAEKEGSDPEDLLSELVAGGAGPDAGIKKVLLDAPIPVSIKDAAGRFLFVNASYERVAGAPREAILGRTDFDLYPPEVATTYRENDLQVIREAVAILRDEPVLIDGVERIFAVMKFPVPRGDEVVAVCGMSLDVTDSALTQSTGSDNKTAGRDAYFGRLLASLTPQEVRVLDLVIGGLSDREIANKLSLAEGTVRHHVSHLLHKLRKRRAQVIIEMLRRRPPKS